DRLLPSATPLVLGGHSLGGQLACCRLALAPGTADALWLVASGAPYWRTFPMPTRAWLPFAYRFLPWLARMHGHLPGRRIGFGGNEAAGVIADWARTAISGRYAATGLARDLDADLGLLAHPVRAVVLARDWLAPRGSLDFLLGKLGRSKAEVACFDDRRRRARRPLRLDEDPRRGRRLVGGSAGVAARIHLLPAPGVAAHRVDVQRGLPAQQRLRARGIGVHLGHVAVPAADDLVRHLAPRGA